MQGRLRTAHRDRSCTVKPSWGSPPLGSWKLPGGATRLSWLTRSSPKRHVIILRSFLSTRCALHSLFDQSLFIHVRALHHYMPTRSSQWSHGSRPICRPTSRSRPPQALHIRTCHCSPRNIREAPSRHPARRPSALAASQRLSAARPAWRSHVAAALFLPNCSWWAWRRSSRSRSTCPHLIG